MKIWYFLCILFCVYSINILIGERYEITYTLDERSEIEQVEHLICMNLNDEKSPFSNQIELRPNELRDKLLKFFEFTSPKKELIESYEKMILDPIRSKNFLIYSNKVCILPNETGIEDSKFSSIQIFMKKTIKLSRYAFNRDTKNLIELKEISQKVNQLIVFNLEHPYSNCTDQNYRKLDCLNKCFKKRNRISKYLYEGDDTESIRLNYDDKNTSLVKDEKECFLECKYDDCKLVYFTSTRSRSRSRPLVIRANPIISPSNYWIQLIGLLSFLANVNLYHILSKIIEIIKSKVLNKKIKKILPYSRPAIFTICSIYCLSMLVKMILDYQNACQIPIKKQTTVNLLEPESFSMFICVDMNNILTKNYKKTRFKMNNFENKTLSVLEDRSASTFNETVDEIYLQFQNKQMPIDWKLIPKVLFKKKLGTIYRCFQIKINPVEPRYQSLLAITKLVVKFRHSRYLIYLEPEDKNFNSNTYHFVKEYSFRKSLYKKLNKRTQCLNYDDRSHCNNYFDCIDRCTSQRFVKKYKNITSTPGGIINKDHFAKEEWMKFYLNENQTKYKEILKECNEETKICECLIIIFEKDVQINQPNQYIKQFDLYYNVIKVVEEEPSIYKLLLNILNIQSVLLGLNIFKLQMMIYFWLTVRTKFKYYLLIVIYLTCLLGFTYQTYYIIKEIVNGELTDSEHYEISKSLKTPEVILCFNFDLLSIDKNRKLTGNYLDELSQHIRLETVFKEIAYLNKSYGWTTYRSNSKTDDLKVKTFYFLNEKCFKFVQDVEYCRSHLFHASKLEILKIFLLRSLVYQEQKVVNFMTKFKSRMQFSKTIDLHFLNPRRKKAYTIDQERFKIIRNDKFNLINNPLSLVYGENDLNDADKYLNKLMIYFANRFNLQTTNLPIQKSDFSDEIDDDLFEQYYLQVQNITDHQMPPNSNFKRSFAKNNLEQYIFVDNKLPDISFGLIFFKKVIKITNEDNYTKLIVNLLNVLSLWFDLGILDLHCYVYNIRFLFLFTCKLVLEIKRKLLIRFQYSCNIQRSK